MSDRFGALVASLQATAEQKAAWEPDESGVAKPLNSSRRVTELEAERSRWKGKIAELEHQNASLSRQLRSAKDEVQRSSLRAAIHSQASSGQRQGPAHFQYGQAGGGGDTVASDAANIVGAAAAYEAESQDKQVITNLAAECTRLKQQLVDKFEGQRNESDHLSRLQSDLLATTVTLDSVRERARSLASSLESAEGAKAAAARQAELLQKELTAVQSDAQNSRKLLLHARRDVLASEDALAEQKSEVAGITSLRSLSEVSQAEEAKRSWMFGAAHKDTALLQDLQELRREKAKVAAERDAAEAERDAAKTELVQSRHGLTKLQEEHRRLISTQVESTMHDLTAQANSHALNQARDLIQTQLDDLEAASHQAGQLESELQEVKQRLHDVENVPTSDAACLTDPLPDHLSVIAKLKIDVQKTEGERDAKEREGFTYKAACTKLQRQYDSQKADVAKSAKREAEKRAGLELKIKEGEGAKAVLEAAVKAAEARAKAAEKAAKEMKKTIEANAKLMGGTEYERLLASVGLDVNDLKQLQQWMMDLLVEWDGGDIDDTFQSYGQQYVKLIKAVRKSLDKAKVALPLPRDYESRQDILKALLKIGIVSKVS